MPDEHQQAVRELVSQWMRRARADLTVTELIDDRRIAPEIVAFHAQQVVEKALKALLVLRQVDFPRTHDLGTLLRLCDTAGYRGIANIAGIVTLTRYAVASRYPGETDPWSTTMHKQPLIVQRRCWRGLKPRSPRSDFVSVYH